MRIVLALATAACGGTHAPAKPQPPPYAALFERGKAWTHDVDVTTGSHDAKSGRFFADHVEHGVLRCRTTEVTATATARTATLACAPPHAGLLVAGAWVGTASGLSHPPAEPTAEELAAQPETAASSEAFVYDHAWCIRETMVGERAHREVALCFDGKGVSGGGELVIAAPDEAWHLARFGKAPVMRDPSKEPVR
ncbi:MAG: hypothetical protein ACM31C_00480 [Acidobacteriota bacterium]